MPKPIHFVPNVIATTITKAVKRNTGKSRSFLNDFSSIPWRTGNENTCLVTLAFKQMSFGTKEFQIFSLSSLLIFLNATGLACFKEVLETSVCMVDMAIVS